MPKISPPNTPNVPSVTRRRAYSRPVADVLSTAEDAQANSVFPYILHVPVDADAP